MQQAGFYAVCPFEIGDRIQCGEKQAVITDILAIHSLKTRKVSFQYEFDNSGTYQKISGRFARAGKLFIPV